jgi:hypothetical protein
MADTVNIQVVYNGIRRQFIHLTNESDGTGESNVTKFNVSDFTDGSGLTATRSTIDLIEYSVTGFNYVVLRWDHTTDDEIAVLSGQGVIDWYAMNGKTDPGTTGGTGDILLTTDGGADGSMYDITLHIRPKAA